MCRNVSVTCDILIVCYHYQLTILIVYQHQVTNHQIVSVKVKMAANDEENKNGGSLFEVGQSI